MTEVIIILGLALILLGPDQLPTIAKSIGKGMREIRKATDDLKSTFEQEMVRMDDPLDAPRALQSVTPVVPAVDGTTPVDPNAVPAPPADPASARAAARRSAAARLPSASMDPMSLTHEQQAQLRLVPPAGAVAQGVAAPAASPAPAAPSAPAASPPDDANKGTP